MAVTAIDPRLQFPVGPETPVTICQLESEFNTVLDLYRHECPTRVLEIGTASGGTLYHWLQNAAPKATIVTIDLPLPDYPGNDHLYPDWTPAGVTLVPIRGNSHDPDVQALTAAHGPYQWLFIDGSHRYADARADWDDYKPMVEPGGLILLHDISLKRTYDDGTEAGVWKLWREIQLESYWTREIRADPRLVEYGVGVVRV